MSGFAPLLTLLLIPALALAAPPEEPSTGDGRFERLRAGSEPLGGLAPFLERYVGACESPEGRAECRASAEAFRKKAAGKTLYMRVGEDVADMLAPGPYDASTGELTVLVTPMFGAAGMALTHGAPRKVDAQGSPLLPRLRLEGSTTEGWTPSRFQRLFSQRELRLDVVFTPEAQWAVGSGARRVQGVRARVLGLRVVHARSGETLATWFSR